MKDQEGNEITNPNHIGIMNPFGYRSYYYDEETKLYYLNSRYYNPEWGRFLNSDSTLGTNGDYIGYNLYSYVSNNPINNSDPTGMFFKKAYQWVKKKANQVYTKATKIISDVADTAINIGNSIKKAFVFEGSPMTMPWEVWNDENTTKEFTFFGHNLLKETENSSLVSGIDSSKNSKFIGISFEGFLVVGGKIKIGFNIGG